MLGVAMIFMMVGLIILMVFGWRDDRADSIGSALMVIALLLFLGKVTWVLLKAGL